MNIENADSFITHTYNHISELIIILEAIRDNTDEGLSDQEKKIYDLSNHLWEEPRKHPEFWEPNPGDNPDLFDDDGDIRPLTKAELAAIVPMTKEEREQADQEIDTLLTDGFGQLIKLANDRGLNKGEFAAVLNISPSLLSNYQAGRKRVTIAMMSAFAAKIKLQFGFDLINRNIFFKPINQEL